MSLTEREVMAALKARHPAPAWAFLEQVRNGTGFGSVTRTADAMAMSLYPSRGLELHGFEVKVSRGDFLRELKDPAKGDELARFCDRWWLVVGDAALVKDGELPPTWGLLVPRGSGLVAKVPAPKLTPEPVTLRFLAALLRNVHAHYTSPVAQEEKVQEAITAAVAATRQRWEAESAGNASGLQQQVAELQRSIAAFEKASGVSIDRWTGGQVGAAVRLVLDAGTDRVIRRLEYMHQELTTLAATLGKSLARTTAPTPPTSSTGDAT